MDIENLIYIFVGVAWLIYSFIKKGKKKTPALSADEVTAELPVMDDRPLSGAEMEEYLPSETQTPLSLLRRGAGGEVMMQQPETRNQSAVGSRQSAVRNQKPETSNQKPEARIQYPFDLKQAVIHYEILKKPEY